MILNPADPPILMGNTLMAVPRDTSLDEAAIRASVDAMATAVQQYVPGYRLKAPVVFDVQDPAWGRRPVIMVLLQVEGAGDFLPPYSGTWTS